MIEKLSLKFGSAPSQPKLNIEIKPITIFVGPNYSGKSQILRDIVQFCQNGGITGNMLESVSLEKIVDFESEITKLTLKPLEGETVTRADSVLFGKRGARHQWNREALRNLFENPTQNFGQFCELFLRHNVIPLDGAARLQMINPESTGNLHHPATKLQILFTDERKRKEVRRIVFDAFGKYFTIDPSTNGGQLFIRLADEEPASHIERSLSDEAIEFHRKSLHIDATSDGVKAFVGLIISIIADDPKVITLDEPEAFLHPSLSFKLGKEIGNILKRDSTKRLFVATHSANFLMGCIQSGVPMNIIRLTYSNRVPTARLLRSDQISRLMKHPLLRSVGTLNGLFYEWVIVTESDADRAFYQEINDRLTAFDGGRGIEHCLFLNAQNKQTVHEIMRPLREMGIPCAGVVDIDVIKEGGTTWANLQNAAFVPEVTKRETEISRSHLKEKFVATGIEYKRNGGIEVLGSADQEACNNLFDRLEEYGIFVVRRGELESWLQSLGVSAAHSPKWLIEIFEKMGEDTASPTYVKPADGDVWDFIGKIKLWFSNSNRKGIPN